MLYTEMVTAPAIIHGPKARLLDFGMAEHPVALQLGGSDPDELARATAIAAPWGYDEVNLNCGCPSDRVQSGCFGAVLMENAPLVADCVRAMIRESDVPVTVKCRIGVDDQNPAEVLPRFIETVAGAGVTHFIVHARKAWLQGLSPKENREIPPLDYPLVVEMKQRFPELVICINGGIASLDVARGLLDQGLDGVMLGRAAYHPPALLGEVDRRVFGEERDVSPAEAVELYRPYVERELAGGTHLAAMTRHMLGLFHGLPGARAWRRILTVEGVKPGAGIEVIEAALAQVLRAQDERRARGLEAGQAA